ncbi:GIY-YIG nuclease family protein [Gramella sp. BOM4]|nr:GIY-YIG nuclease family protein [Christiangramia bathymodioli]
MMYVYVLRSLKNDSMYVGMSSNVEKRICEHNSKRVRSTKAYCPWKLIHLEVFEDRISARKREKYLKSGYGKSWLKNKYS